MRPSSRIFQKDSIFFMISKVKQKYIFVQVNQSTPINQRTGCINIYQNLQNWLIQHTKIAHIQLGQEYMNIYDSKAFLLKCSLTPLVRYENRDKQFWWFTRMLSFPYCNTFLHKISSAQHSHQKIKQVIKKSHAY